MILIDNYDSFTYNIVQYLRELGVDPKIFKNDAITIAELKEMNFSSIIISAGPKSPNEAGISLDIIGEFYNTKKILGICLGHQCIAQYFGCKVIKAKVPVHGKVSKIYFERDLIFEGLKQGFEATRYHSLLVENTSIVECIKPLAYADEGSENLRTETLKNNFQHLPIMALRHKDYPIYGMQFHPESVLTQSGKVLLKNFLNL